MKKYVVIILVGFLLAIILIIGTLIFAFAYPFKGLTGKTTYEETLTQTEKLYKQKKNKFHSAKDNILEKQATDGEKISGVERIYMTKRNADNCIIIDFSVGAQGLSGGQYWGVYYVSKDKPADVFMCEGEFQDGPYEGAYYKNSEEHTFYATEKIDEFWYFYYMDYDGNKHGLDW